MAVTLSEKAAKHVASYLVKRGKGIGLRLGVRTSGCSGVAYKLEFADVADPDDIEFESHGVKVLIDAMRLEFDVIRIGNIGKLELVGHARASAGAHAKAQTNSLAALDQITGNVFRRFFGKRNRH